MRDITGSISKGKLAPRHNTREDIKDRKHCPKHIDFERIKDDVFIVNRKLPELYRDVFGEALEQYNAKQKRADRKIPDYFEKVSADKKLKVGYEYVIQCGNKDDKLDPEDAARVYSEFVARFQERYGKNFVVAQAIVHMDEATPHMHFEVVPVAHSKRGLSLQNSLSKAIEQAGFADYKPMLADWDSTLTEVMERHGLNRIAGDKDKQLGGVDIDTYKATMAWKEGIEREASEKLEAQEKEIAKGARELSRSRSKVKGYRTAEKRHEKALAQAKQQERQARKAAEAQHRAFEAARAKTAQEEAALAAVAAERDKALSDLNTATKQLDAVRFNKRNVEAQLLETRAELGTAKNELAEKQASSAALSNEIAKKTAEKEGIAAEIGDFSSKREAMKAEEERLNERLEYLRLTEKRDSSIESEYQQLTNEEQALRQENQRLAADSGAARRDRRFEDERARLRGRESDAIDLNRSLRARVEELLDKVVELFGVISGLPPRIAEFIKDEFGWDRDLPFAEERWPDLNPLERKAAEIRDIEQVSLADMASLERDAFGHNRGRGGNKNKGYDDPEI